MALCRKQWCQRWLDFLSVLLSLGSAIKEEQGGCEVLNLVLGEVVEFVFWWFLEENGIFSKMIQPVFGDFSQAEKTWKLEVWIWHMPLEMIDLQTSYSFINAFKHIHVSTHIYYDFIKYFFWNPDSFFQSFTQQYAEYYSVLSSGLGSESQQWNKADILLRH